MLPQHLLDDGPSKTAIAQRFNVSRRVIYHWLRTGQLARDVDTPVPRQYAPRPTQLDPFTGRGMRAAPLKLGRDPELVRCL